MSVPDHKRQQLEGYLKDWLHAVARRCLVAVPDATMQRARDDVMRHFESRHGRVITVDGRPACSICGSRGLVLVERRRVIYDLSVTRNAEAAANVDVTRLWFQDEPRSMRDEHYWSVECGCGAELVVGDDVKVLVGEEVYDTSRGLAAVSF